MMTMQNTRMNSKRGGKKRSISEPILESAWGNPSTNSRKNLAKNTVRFNEEPQIFVYSTDEESSLNDSMSSGASCQSSSGL
jgi:hypothetical protein